MRDYKKLEVWKRAHLMTTFVYKDVVVQLPKDEMFALVSQMKRANEVKAMLIAFIKALRVS